MFLVPTIPLMQEPWRNTRKKSQLISQTSKAKEEKEKARNYSPSESQLSKWLECPPQAS